MASNYLAGFFSVTSPQPLPPPSWSTRAQYYLQDARVNVPLAILGSYTAFFALKWLANFAYIFLRPSSLPRSRHPSGQPYLTYALITGSTDGIGRALAFELSRRGFALVLHGRNPTKLDALAAEIHAAHKALGAPKPRSILATADQCRDIDFAALVAPLRTLRLTVLVNNVGAQGHLADNPFRTLTEYTREDVDRLVDLNAIFMIQLTRELIPVMLRASDATLPDNAFDYPVKIKAGHARKPGARAPTAQILNASSAAAVGVPYVTAYAGSKGFVDALTTALRNEFRAEYLPASRIDAMSLRIGNTVTNTNLGQVRLFMPDAQTYAAAICDRVGCGEHVVIPYLWHWIQVNFFSNLGGRALLDYGIIMNMRWKVAEYNQLYVEKQAKEVQAQVQAQIDHEPAPTPAKAKSTRKRK